MIALIAQPENFAQIMHLPLYLDSVMLDIFARQRLEFQSQLQKLLESMGCVRGENIVLLVAQALLIVQQVNSEVARARRVRANVRTAWKGTYAVQLG